MARVVIKDLTKYFGDVRAIENFSVNIRDKEFLALLGPSGCGKTTTLRCVAGLEKPEKGDIYIGDTLVNDLPPKDRDVAMVFQSYAIYPHMNVFDNIAFPLKMHKFPKDEIRKKVMETTQLLQISNLLDRKPKELSGGQRQRVALGRAIIREPKVFLMDEPLSNLDAKLRIHMRAELKALQKRIGITTIFVTHDQVEAMTMSERIVLLNDGLLQQIDSPDEIFIHPKNMFTAGFIGSPPMNFVDCNFVEKDGDALLDASTFTIDVSDFAEILKKNATTSELTFGIRPEHVRVSKKNPKGEAIKSKVYVMEPLGTELLLDLQTDGSIFKVKEKADFKADVGDELWMAFDKEKMHIFDRESGKTIV